MCDSCRIRQDDMSPSGNAFLGRKWEPRSDSELTIFNLIIRLSKMKQMASFLVEQLVAVPGTTFLFRRWSCTDSRRTFVFQLCPREYGARHCITLEGIRTYLQVWYFLPFMVFGEVLKLGTTDSVYIQGWIDYRGPWALSRLLHAIVDASFFII